ncbi:helix-turn-helix domain-containing protein [Saccharopolyspora spinosa]
MARRGPKRRLDLESEYWRLLACGVGTVEACQLLGIGRKTEYRWRAENGKLPPVSSAEDARSSRFLSQLERQRIATLRRQGLVVREIASHLGRSVDDQPGPAPQHARARPRPPLCSISRNPPCAVTWCAPTRG